MKLSPKVGAPVALKNTLYILANPLYALVAVVAAFVVCGLFIWSLNLPVLWYVITEAPLTIGKKLGFMLYGYKSVVQGGDKLFSVLAITASLLAGIQTALLVRVLRQRSSPGKKQTAVGGSGLGLAILSSGCMACGTSLLAPVLASVGATSVSVLHIFGSGLLFVSSLMFIYAIYRLALLVDKTSF